MDPKSHSVCPQLELLIATLAPPVQPDVRRHMMTSNRLLEASTGRTVVGVDVAGSRRGFHAVAIRDDAYFGQCKSVNPTEIVEWCLTVGASFVGVDSPCQWSLGIGRRKAELELAAEGISSFPTPTRDRAAKNAFFEWMLNGERLFMELARAGFSLFEGRVSPGQPLVYFETYPHAVACALSGRVISAENKKAVRLQLLLGAGVETPNRSGMDIIDAGLCALTARCLAEGEYETYGRSQDGFIVVPGSTSTS